MATQDSLERESKYVYLIAHLADTGAGNEVLKGLEFLSGRGYCFPKMIAADIRRECEKQKDRRSA